MKVFDTTTGALLWRYEVQGYYQNYDDGSNSTIVFLDSASGNVTFTVHNASYFSAITNNMHHLVYTNPSNDTGALNVLVIDVNTKRTLWQGELPGISNAAFYVLDETLIIVATGTSSWAASLGLLAGGDTCHWNSSLPWNASMLLAPSVMQVQGTYILSGSAFLDLGMVPAVQTTFISLDKATGKTVFEFSPPTTPNLNVIVFAGEHLVVPNLMGWNRFSIPSRRRGDEVIAPLLQYQTLRELEGVFYVMARGSLS